MAQSMQISSINTDDDTIYLIGNIVSVAESILSPKPVNVWHVPGAFSRITKCIEEILYHGCIDESGEKLWTFIIGLRVLRPDIWPTFDLRHLSGSEIQPANLIKRWIQVSLESHKLYQQFGALLCDQERVALHYHHWAFLRSIKLTHALLIVFQSIENNAQHLLAKVEPKLMVLYHKIRDRNKTKSNLKSITEMPIENQRVNRGIIGNNKALDIPTLSKNICFEGSNRKKLLSKSLSDSALDTYRIFEDGENETAYPSFASSNISPSALEVYYESAYSECERNDGNFNDGVDKNMEISPGLGLYNSILKKNSAHSKDDNGLNARRNLSKSFLKKSSHHHKFKPTKMSNNFSSTNECNNIHLEQAEGDLLSPSKFLINYLSQKNKYKSESCNSPIKGGKDFISKRLSLQLPTDAKDEPILVRSKESLNAVINQAVVPTSRPLQESPNLKSRDKVNEATFEKNEIKRKIHSHKRSQSDGAAATYLNTNKNNVQFTEKNMGNESLSRNFCNSLNNRPNGRQPMRPDSSDSENTKCFLEDGGHSISTEADGFFPQPRPGQNLIEFLSSLEYSCASAQLDRENAHFSVAEVVMAAIEQMNSNCQSNSRSQRPTHLSVDESEDDRYTKRRSIRRRLRSRRPKQANMETTDDEPHTTDHSLFDSPVSSELSDQEEVCHSNSKSLSSDDLSSTEPASAENVAISLLMHYNTQLLPKASELQWLVSETEVPQKLLPLPNSVPVSPDEPQITTLLRGTADWAPPRPQLVLTLHNNTKRSTHLMSQNYRCAGCGVRVTKRLSIHFRFCQYLGRYFCTVCHSNKKACLPARVVLKWDFKFYPVCNFSLELLTRMKSDPLFHLRTLNPGLYRCQRKLAQAHFHRVRLVEAMKYIFACKRAEGVKDILERYPNHWYSDSEIFSLEDLVLIKSDIFTNQMKELASTCINHVSSCEICEGHGFICEICRKGATLFPFQLSLVKRCNKCHACFHIKCFTNDLTCCRCQRRESRNKIE